MPASAVEPATTMEACSTVSYCSAVKAANRSAPAEACSTAHSNSGTAVEAAVTIESAAAVEAWASVKSAVEPRTSPDEEAAGEIARPVVTVRRAGVRVISVVAISARRRSSHVARSSHSDADRQPLGAGVRGRRQANAK